MYQISIQKCGVIYYSNNRLKGSGSAAVEDTWMIGSSLWNAHARLSRVCVQFIENFDQSPITVDWTPACIVILGKVYAVLSDGEQRGVYDEQGIVDEETDVLKKDRDWEEYWRLLFKKVTVADIKDFEDKYKGSEEETADIKQAYLDFEGDMDGIMESVLCSTSGDESRIRTILEVAIEAQELPVYTVFTKESTNKQRARKRRGDREAKEAEAVRQELGLEDGSDSLKTLIQKKQKDREKQMDSFLAAMEAKYCANSHKGGKKAAKKGKK
ncbi:dnaJ homolog subfamily C member 9 [Heterodontus francisci]|uniref:dnaJ homolog subfamily C member 9 n=1 Tax=Heterodontus francisci TaxID=7792 RepID=UPI00355C3401